jgi:hypothetical protein
MSVNNENELIVKDFSFLHLFASPMSLAAIFALNFVGDEIILVDTSWINTLLFILINIGFIAAFIMCSTFSIITVFDKEKQNVSSRRYTFFGKKSSKLNFEDIIKLDIREEKWGENTRKGTLFISVGENIDITEEIPIIQANKPSICIKNKKEILEFIGLSDIKEDESNPPQ